MVCMCVWCKSRIMPKNNIVIVVVSTKTSRGDTFAHFKQKNGTKAQFHLTIFSPLLWLDRLLAMSP